MNRSKAFTLVEVLMAIVIIGILIAILLPAVGAAMRAGRRSSVVAEIGMFSQAIAGFTLANGGAPPSRFVCSETGDYSVVTLTASGSLRDEVALAVAGVPWASLTPTQQATVTAIIDRLSARTVADLRVIWSKVTVSRAGPVQVIPGIGFYDFNGNGQIDPPYLLTGDECLAWFLGGIPKPFQTSEGATGFGMIGFSNLSRNPFLPESYLDPTSGALTVMARQPPSVEFRTERLIDADGDGVPNYADSYSGAAFPTPYAYFSNLSGQYDPDDCNFATEPDGSPSPRGGFVTGATGIPGSSSSLAPNPYTTSDPIPANGLSTWAFAGTCQIISAGQDRQFGPGGRWDGYAKSSTKVPFNPTANQVVTGTLLGPDARYVERDNLSNFAGGPLD